MTREEEEETISVDEEESEDEGPHSWPGRKITTSSPLVPSESFLKSLGLPRPPFPTATTPATAVHPMTAAAQATPIRPLILGSPTSLPSHCGLPMPTIFTILPHGLVQTSHSSIATSFMPKIQSPVTSVMSPVTPPQSERPSVLNFLPSEKQPRMSDSSPASTPSCKTNQIANSKCATTLAAIPPEEMTPAYLELKDFAESFKNRRIQLGYTQGAVGQSLADRGYSNFAQSTISRFEQMQLSPSNAAAIKVVLERWLHETDNPEGVTSSSLDPLGPPRKRKKRAVFSTQTRDTLEEYFRKEARPNRQIIETIAEELSLLPEEVRVWFCNKRQKFKLSDDHSSMSDDVKSIPSPGSCHAPSSPPRTKFTIEELSKSSSSTNATYTNATITSIPQQPQPFMFPAGRFPSQPLILNNHLVTKA